MKDRVIQTKNVRCLSSVFFFTLLFCWALFPVHAQEQEEQFGKDLHTFRIEIPRCVLSSVPCDISVSALDEKGNVLHSYTGRPQASGILTERDGRWIPLDRIGPFRRGQLLLPGVRLSSSTITVIDGKVVEKQRVRIIPGILSLLPPLLAIALALLFRQVLLSLFCGIWLGATFLFGYNPFLGFVRVLDHYLVNALADRSHAAIILFSLTLGGMVGIIARSGGAQGIVTAITRGTGSPRRAQIATWAMGIFIFIDDYANSLLVGNTMRPFTDTLRISREKLAYLVDATAAPVSSIAIISTWIGFELGLVGDAFTTLGLDRNVYMTFLQTIPYRFYSLFTLFFVFLIAITLRDYGTMREAEVRARRTGKVLRDGAEPLTDKELTEAVAPEGTPLRWYNGLIPILTVIVVTLVGLWSSGRSALGSEAANAPLYTIFSSADSFSVLMWASFIGAGVAALLTLSQRILSLKETMEAWVSGAKSMFFAMLILVSAWSIGSICKDLSTADYVVHVSKGVLTPHLIPLAAFLISAFIGFSTGTSWGTMAILMPIVIPLAYKIPLQAGLVEGTAGHILLGAIAGVLAGATFGDHCSPISDTTILSSMASACDHIDHVRTQMPYALTTGAAACLLGYLPAGFGFSPYVCLGMGSILLFFFLRMFGKKV
ncbi:MAG: Na+/H+ antiporter NhaC family protein [Gemmatimonadota bacterium]|nr:MAG: Na+/H+ antiporter NhaC family protein [Gemmatimonadota bacterium]